MLNGANRMHACMHARTHAFTHVSSHAHARARAHTGVGSVYVQVSASDRTFELLDCNQLTTRDDFGAVLGDTTLLRMSLGG